MKPFNNNDDDNDEVLVILNCIVYTGVLMTLAIQSCPLCPPASPSSRAAAGTVKTLNLAVDRLAVKFEMLKGIAQAG